MKYVTKLKLAAVHQLCDVEEKSTEYTIQAMQDLTKVDLDGVVNYLQKEDHVKLFKELNDIMEVVIKIEQVLSK